jgi:two-component system CheB/CheR fusion protein
LSLILAVDDEGAGLYFRKLILEHAGHAVLSAQTTEEALGLFRSHPVDLVLTDHLLGRNTGLDMAQEMKRSKPRVPIILLSGTTSVPEPLEYADRFLSKTEGPDALLEAVEDLLGSSKPSNSLRPSEHVEALPLPALLAAIVENSDDAIFSKTLDGYILTWNEAAHKMYGYRPEEVIGHHISLLLPPERPCEVEQILKRLRRGEKIDHFETTRQTKDGQVLQVSLTVSPVRDTEGSIIAASTIARDITQSKLAEEALRSSERLAVAGRMAATIAHEINNPLETVSNILYLLQRNPSLDDSARSYVQVADEELRRVGQITRTTLGLYRERDTSIVPVNLLEILETILMLYQRQIQSLGVRVERRFASVAQVDGVPGELRQVFSNLIANAIDALSVTGRRLIVRIRTAVDWKGSGGRGVRVTIADDGPGMSAQTQAKLFQPFYTTKGRKGTGVGLWVSRGIIEKHQGRIRLKSKVGDRHGTCFTVFLPAQSQATSQTQ